MPATPAANRKLPHAFGAPATLQSSKKESRELVQLDENAFVRLHITPFSPALLKVYLTPSVLPSAKNISYHTVETFPEKGFGYVELPTMEAQKLKKKLNGSTLKGSKVRIEDAKPEKRKAVQDAESGEDKVSKRVKKEKRKNEQGVLEGVELPEDRTVKRGWTDPSPRNRKDKKMKERDKKDKKVKQKDSKYTKEPELLFKTKLTPVAATEATRKKKSKIKKEKIDKKKCKDEAVVHEFENNTKQPSFLKSTQMSKELKPAVEYINGKGWVDEDGNVVEAETGKARNRRVLELVDSAPGETVTEKQPSVPPEVELSPKSRSKTAKSSEKNRSNEPAAPSSSSSEAEVSSVLSSSSDSGPELDVESEADLSASSPVLAAEAPQIALTPSSPLEKKEVHPLEALYKRPRPTHLSMSGIISDPNETPAKALAPINTSFSFFDNENMEIDEDTGAASNVPVTPYTQRDLEWRGLRSAAPTPDTGAIGRRFSFPWRKGSQEADDDDDDDDDVEAGRQLSNNTKANTSVNHLPGVTEEDEGMDDADEEAKGDDGESGDEANQSPLGARTGKKIEDDDTKEESEFSKWFWENRGDNNRAWKKRRRDALKTKRLRDNRKITGSRKI